VISKPDKNKLRQKRHTRVRGKISGTSETPRLNVFRSNTNIYAQVIDDVTGKLKKPQKLVNSLLKLQKLKALKKLSSTAVVTSITDVLQHSLQQLVKLD